MATEEGKDKDPKRKIQNDQYEYPYHYIPELDDGSFSQHQYWSWGFRYLGGLQVVFELLDSLEFSSLLDIGCGDGRFLREAASEYPDIELMGIDHSKRAIEMAKAMNPGTDFRCLDITQKNLDRSFEVATLIEVLEHIPPKKIDKFLGSISNTLDDGSYLVITVPHKNKKVNPKHYQHFDIQQLDNTMPPEFESIKYIPFDNSTSTLLSKLSSLISEDMGGFIVTNKKVLDWFWGLYTNHYLYSTRENCGRVAAVFRKQVQEK